MASVVTPEILEALATGPKTAAELRTLTGRSITGIYMPLMQLRRERQVYISEWLPQRGLSGRRPPVYALGDLPDAPKSPHAAPVRRPLPPLEQQLRALRADSGNPWCGLL